MLHWYPDSASVGRLLVDKQIPTQTPGRNELKSDKSSATRMLTWCAASGAKMWLSKTTDLMKLCPGKEAYILLRHVKRVQHAFRPLRALGAHMPKPPSHCLDIALELLRRSHCARSSRRSFLLAQHINGRMKSSSAAVARRL